MRAQCDLLGAVALEAEPSLDEILGEDVAAEQEVAIRVERREHLFQRARGLLDLGFLLVLELVHVRVDRDGRLDLVDHAVETGHEARREREVRVARWVRGTELEPHRGLDRKSTRLNSSHVASSYA